MKKISPVRAFLLAGLLFLPAFALAQGGAPELVKGFGTVGDVVNSFTKNVVTALSTLFATMAMAAFFFGLVQYIWGVRDGKPEKVKAGNQFMIYGLLALFVMFSVWGIITYAQKIFGVTGSTIVIPTIQIQGSEDQRNPRDIQAVQSGGSILNSNSGNSSVSNTSQSKLLFKGGDGGCDSGYTQSENGECVNVMTGAPQPTTISKGTYACDPQDASCSNTSSSKSSDLSAYIKQCQAQDSSKTYIVCWQEYSNNTTVQSTTETISTSNTQNDTTVQQASSPCRDVFGCDNEPFDPANCTEGWHLNYRKDGCEPD